MASQLFGILLIPFIILLPCEATNTRESQLKVVESHKKVSTAEVTIKAESPLHCAMLCRREILCTSAAYDAKEGLCYLLPIFSAGPGTDMAFELHTYSEPICQEPETVNAANAHLTIRDKSLISWDADVDCRDDFMYFGNDSPTARCQGKKWTVSMAGECKQDAWTNLGVLQAESFPLPRSPEAGWTFCLIGTARDQTGFSIIALDETFFQNLYTFIFEMDKKNILLNVMSTGAWLNLTRPDRGFPFAVGSLFNLTVKFVTFNKFEMYTNQDLYATKEDCPMNVNNTANIMILKRVDISYFSVWFLR